MGAYLVHHRYSSRTTEGEVLAFEGGTTVEVADEVATWVNLDSPGTLSAVDGDTQADTQAESTVGTPAQEFEPIEPTEPVEAAQADALAEPEQADEIEVDQVEPAPARRGGRRGS